MKGLETSAKKVTAEPMNIYENWNTFSFRKKT